jgi:hypothetical protein
MSEWRPIETAPDGDVIIAVRHGNDWSVGQACKFYYSNDKPAWVWAEDYDKVAAGPLSDLEIRGPAPALWQPLPEPPA